MRPAVSEKRAQVIWGRRILPLLVLVFLAVPWFVHGGEDSTSEEAIRQWTEKIDSETLSGRELGQAFFQRGRLLGLAGRFEEALQDFDRAAPLDPDNPVLFHNRGYIKSKIGDFDGAIKDFDQAIRLDPDRAASYLSRGNARIWSRPDSVDGALADFTRAIELNPMLFSAWSNRGNIFARQGKWKKAMADYGRSLEIKPDYHAFHNRGNVWAMLGRYDQAVSDYSRSIELNPGYAPNYFRRAKAYMALGRRTDAKQDLEKAAALDPGNAFFLQTLKTLEKTKQD